MNNSGRSQNSYSLDASSPPAIRDNVLLASESTEINIDTSATTQSLHVSNQVDGRVNSTSIDMNGTDATRRPGTSSVQRDFLTIFSEARNQFDRQSSLTSSMQRPQDHIHTHLDRNHGATRHSNSNRSEHYLHQLPLSNQHSPTHSRNLRSWRMNLNNVLSFSSAPSTETIRSLITSSGNFRYTPLNANESGNNILMHPEPRSRRGLTEHTFNSEDELSNTAIVALRNEDIGSTAQVSETFGGGTENNNVQNVAVSGNNSLAGVDTSSEGEVLPTIFMNRNAANRNTLQEDEDNNVISDMFVKFLSHFVRYLPFICILCVKFVHDHSLGIMDLLLLHGIMYQINKSLRNQISKFSQKSYRILFRDFGLVGFVVIYRLLLASSSPDPFGMLITPPTEGVKLELAKTEINSDTKQKLSILLSSFLGNTNAIKDQHSAVTPLENTVTITKAISLGVLLYYVAVNDLILKLITILLKISITLMPTKVIRHKRRARIYVLVEYFSQIYRALAPVRQWLMFLFESYSGLEMISGVLFSSFYMGAKGFEFVERGKSLKKALLNFFRNMDYERYPTKDELDAAGSICPICHDTYSNPVVLECGHIFCDDCVSTWLKREQTCPMCRAKVSEEIIWQDGATTYFYQLC